MKMYLCAVNNIVAYGGNRLTGVTEAAADYDATGTFEYKGANGSEYLYDSNGSLIADRSRRAQGGQTPCDNLRISRFLGLEYDDENGWKHNK